MRAGLSAPLLLLVLLGVHGLPRGHHKFGGHDKPGEEGQGGSSQENSGLPSDPNVLTSEGSETPSDDAVAPQTQSGEAEAPVVSGGDVEETGGGSEVTPSPPQEEKPCAGIICAPPPFVQGAQCRATTNQQINPVIPMLGSQADCCPVHVCVRPDGSQFTHYGIQSESFSSFSTGPVAQQPFLLMGPPPPNSFPQGPPGQVRYYQQQQQQQIQQQQQLPPSNFQQGGPFNRQQPGMQSPPQFNFVPFFGGQNGPFPSGGGPFASGGGGPFTPTTRVNRSPIPPTTFGGIPQLMPGWEMIGGMLGGGGGGGRDRREYLAPQQNQGDFGGGPSPYGFRV